MTLKQNSIIHPIGHSVSNIFIKMLNTSMMHTYKLTLQINFGQLIV